MEEKMPLVSIIMSVYNEERYIQESLDSVLSQTLDNFELIIIDDCSTDKTTEMIEGYHDSRIRLYRNKKNQGLTKNLNNALRYCRGEYIARMDGDDICLPQRLEKQVQYMEEHQEKMLIGCRTQTFGEQNLVSRLPDHSEQLRIMLLLRPVLAHPSFMMRRRLVTEFGFHYDESFRSAQDYDFAQRVSERFAIGIVPEVLLRYRTHKKQVSSKASGEQYQNADRVRYRQLQALNVELDKELKTAYSAWAREERTGDIKLLLDASRVIEKICAGNREIKKFPEKELEDTLRRMLFTWMFRTKSFAVLKKAPLLCRKGKDYWILLSTAVEIGWNKLKRDGR